MPWSCFPAGRLNFAARLSAERAKAHIERIPRWLQDFHCHRLGPFDSVAAGVPLRLSIEKSPKFHHCLAIGCRLSLSTSASVRCDIPIRAASFPPLKPALVLPRVSKRLTLGRWSVVGVYHACGLVSMRSVIA